MSPKVRPEINPDQGQLEAGEWSFQYQLALVLRKPRERKVTCTTITASGPAVKSRRFKDGPAGSAENQAYAWISKLKSAFLWQHNDSRLEEPHVPK